MAELTREQVLRAAIQLFETFADNGMLSTYEDGSDTPNATLCRKMADSLRALSAPAPQQNAVAELVELFLREARLMPSLPIGESFEEREQWTDWVTMVLKNCGAYQVASTSTTQTINAAPQVTASTRNQSVDARTPGTADSTPAVAAPELIAGLANAWPEIREALSRRHEGGRRAGLKEVEVKLDSMIVRGDLPGNGCDKSAERNGLILAYNAVWEMTDRALKTPKGGA